MTSAYSSVIRSAVIRHHWGQVFYGIKLDRGGGRWEAPPISYAILGLEEELGGGG